MAEITVADLKAREWKFRMHGDGSDKGGRFSINFYRADVDGVIVDGWRKRWARGQEEAGYSVEGETVSTLKEVAMILSKRFTAGDAPEARDD